MREESKRMTIDTEVLSERDVAGQKKNAILSYFKRNFK